MHLRCSSLPLAFQCPGAVRADEADVPIEIAHEAGALGSAVHAVLARLVLDPLAEIPDLRPTGLKHAVDLEDLGALVAFGAQAWREIREAFPNPLTEQELRTMVGPVSLTGHADVLAYGEEWANLLDWKSGYKQGDYYHQIQGYACLILSQMPEIQEVRATLVWLRDRTMETIRISRQAAEAWAATLQQTVIEWDGTYRAGSHCQYCRRFATCPARQALVRSAVTELLTDELPPAPEAHLAELVPRMVALRQSGRLALAKQALDRIDELIRLAITVHGPIDLGNGKELALVPQPRDVIAPLTAWPVLNQYLSEEQLAPAVKIGKTALLEAVGATVAKGKGKLKTEVMEALKQAGAVSQIPSQRLTERIIEKEVLS